MPHAAWHIICGTGGTPVTDKQVTVYDAPLSVAIKIDVNELEAQAVAAGMDPAKARRRLDKFVAMLEQDYWRWGEYLSEKLCVDYQRHDPHPQNLQ